MLSLCSYRPNDDGAWMGECEEEKDYTNILKS